MVQVTVENIKPQQAQDLLANQVDKQRKLDTKRVGDFATMMRMGQFRLSNDAIVIVRGLLGNGQHRLSAVVLSKLAAPFIVMRSTDDTVFDIMDCGKSRSVGQALSHEMRHATNSGSVARLVLAYEREVITPSTVCQVGDISRCDILAYCREHQSDLESLLSQASVWYYAQRLLSPTVVVAFQICAGTHREAAGQFVGQVVTGDGDLCVSAKALRNRLIQNATSKSRLPAAYILGLLIKGFNVRTDTKCLLKIREGEDFPRFDP